MVNDSTEYDVPVSFDFCKLLIFNKFFLTAILLETYRRACTMFQPRSCTFVPSYKTRAWRGRQDRPAGYQKPLSRNFSG